MAKFKDFLPGISEGLLTSIEKQRDRKAALQDALALLTEKHRLETPQRPDINTTVALLKSLGLQPSRATVSATGETGFGFSTPRPAPGEAKSNAIIKQALASKAQINDIYQQAETALPAITDRPGNFIPGGVEAITGGIVRKGLASTGFNEPARAFMETQVANARQTIRGLGEVGVLTDKDVADAVKLLPASTDSDVVRKSKLNALNRLIDVKLGVYQTKQTPMNTPADEDQAFIDQLEAQGYTVQAAP